MVLLYPDCLNWFWVDMKVRFLLCSQIVKLTIQKGSSRNSQLQSGSVVPVTAVSRTKSDILSLWAINSIGRVLPLHGRSHRFESCIAHNSTLSRGLLHASGTRRINVLIEKYLPNSIIRMVQSVIDISSQTYFSFSDGSLMKARIDESEMQVQFLLVPLIPII